MARVLVVYDSGTGNTEKMAHALGRSSALKRGAYTENKRVWARLNHTKQYA